MKIGSKYRGIEIYYRQGIIGIAWWRPVLNRDIATADLSLLKLCGFVRRARRVGVFEVIDELRSLTAHRPRTEERSTESNCS